MRSKTAQSETTESSKEEARKWAEEILAENSAKKEIENDFIELMIFGNIGYKVDKEGNTTKLTQEELFEMKFHPDAIITNLNLEDNEQI